MSIDLEKFLYEYYDESRIKQSRRSNIINNLIPFILDNGIENITYKDMSGYLGMERRSMYDYYPTKEEIIVDVAYICEHQLLNHYSTNTSSLKETYKEYDSLKKLKYVLKDLIFILETRHTSLIIFLYEFSIYLYNLDPKSNAYIRFNTIKRKSQDKTHYLYDMIKDIYEDKNIVYSQTELDNIVVVFEQSLFSYMGNLLINKKLNTTESINLCVDLLCNGLLNSL